MLICKVSVFEPQRFRSRLDVELFSLHDVLVLIPTLVLTLWHQRDREKRRLSHSARRAFWASTLSVPGDSHFHSDSRARVPLS